MRERNACTPYGASPVRQRLLVVELLCSGCDRIVGELHANEVGGLGRIDGANTRGAIRYLSPSGPPSRAPRHSSTPGGSDEDLVRFYCDDRCGIRYAIPRARLEAAFGRIDAHSRGAPTVARIRLPVRGRRDGRAPKLQRRAARHDGD
jgi:hypothetical protein